MTAAHRLMLHAGWLFVAGLALAGMVSRLDSWRSAPRRATVSTPHRLVSMAPSLTECLFAIGAGERVIAVDDWSVYPPTAASLPRVGGYFNPNFERLLAVRPDAIVIQGQHEKMATFCAQQAIPMWRVEINTVDSIYLALDRLGRELECESGAAQAQAELRARLAAVQQRAATRARVSTFICLSRMPNELTQLGTVNGRSFLGELLKLAGGDNIFDEIPQEYPEISKETLLTRAPELILELRPGEALTDEQKQVLVHDWDALPTLPAVQHGRILILNEDFLLIPGPRVALIAEALARALHPD